jgi:hypothetical protein
VNPRTARRNVVASQLGLATLMLLAWAGRGAADDVPSTVPCPTPRSQRRIVYRPPFPAYRPKQLFITNYAGATYPPVFSRNRAVETSAQSPPPPRRFGWPWGSR